MMIEDMGLPIATNQVSFSIIDQRPKQKGMTQLCEKHGVKMLCYGTLLGGFLSDLYLGKEMPVDGNDLNTSSKKKYIRFIKQWGTWKLFQELLQVLHNIAQRYDGVNISMVAQRYVLEQKCVAGVIIGARLSITDHSIENKKVLEFKLKPEDIEEIEQMVAKGKPLPGDCGNEYRS